MTEGYSTQKGELALGRNLKVAFMPWKGYNFEDAIVISERMMRDDIFTSVHVDEYIMEVRDTKRGVEELTSDIPNVSEDATKDLDENGIIRICFTSYMLILFEFYRYNCYYVLVIILEMEWYYEKSRSCD